MSNQVLVSREDLVKARRAVGFLLDCAIMNLDKAEFAKWDSLKDSLTAALKKQYGSPRPSPLSSPKAGLKRKGK